MDSVLGRLDSGEGEEMSNPFKDNDNPILVMNKDTWEKFRRITIEHAQFKLDPIAHIVRITGIDIYLDEELQDEQTEAWDKETYISFRKARGDWNELGEDIVR